MTGPEILVLTTVHASDDTRIRERLIRSLSGLGNITYATRAPAPTDLTGVEWILLPGSRVRRNIKAFGLLLGGHFDLVVLHDPETVPAGVVARLLRRSLVVFDVHEDLAGQISSKDRIPGWLKPFARSLARALYRLAEMTLTLTLAEPGYQRLFRHEHVVFPNFPRTASFPPVKPNGAGFAIYVGDITEARGIEDAARACLEAGVPLVAIGRFDAGLGETLLSIDDSIELTGRLSNPEALDRLAGAAVGLSPLRDEPNYRMSLPTKVLEYLAMGVPVVATDLPGTREVLSGLAAVAFVPPGDVQAMADAVTEMMSPGVRAAATEQSSEMRVRFNWPESEVRAFYSRLLTRGETPDPS
ncbi:MAG: glycosyltransferase [Acidimicrobiia bacterium]